MKPPFSFNATNQTGHTAHAEVLTDGNMQVDGILSAVDALKLADWIYDNFGEAGSNEPGK